MEKKEKKADLEQLLNSLIEKGWKPRGYENCIRLNADGGYIISMEDENRSIELDKSIRDLTAKESGLWQFVCENGMIKEGDVKNFVWTRYEHTGFEPQYPLVHKWNSAEYRLIESSLKDESELEDFLLNSISLHE